MFLMQWPYELGGKAVIVACTALWTESQVLKGQRGLQPGGMPLNH